MQEKTVTYITPEEYLAAERKAETKSEYFNGEIFAKAGASRNHNLIVANLITELGAQLRKTPCPRVYPSDMRVQVATSGLYTYPDVTIVRGEEKFGDKHRDTLLNPNVIIEVLSDTTESYDRGRKFTHYRNLTSLKEYILVSQSIQKIERYFRNEMGRWELDETFEDRRSLDLEAINCKLEIEAVYDKTDG